MQSTEDFQDSETNLPATIMVDACHYTFVQAHRMHTPRVNPIVNYGLQVIMMCPNRFINYSRCTTVVGDNDNGENHVCEGKGYMEISLLPLNLPVNLKLF